MKHKQTNKLWGAAFTQTPEEAVISFTAGRDVTGLSPADMALLPYDIWVNQAHVVMLAKTGIIPVPDAKKILDRLIDLDTLAKSGTFVLDPAKEDVHTNVESWLTGQLGIQVAGRVHTARSRNDQVAADMKMYLRSQVLLFIKNSIQLTHVLLGMAAKTKGMPMPGFTHHQHAMATTFGHVLAGFAAMIIRDIGRLEGWYMLHNSNPLGGMAGYGTSYPIDSKMTAGFLGFDSVCDNSMDTITNRWEAEADLGFDITVLMNHLSLISETLILMTTPEFGMATLSEAFSTGSSVMPQKKNPDPLEVMKGKTGFAQGQLMSLLSIGKSNFIGYNRDSQWTKYIVMDVIRECAPTPIVLAGVLETITVHGDVMESWCRKGYIGAAALMEQLIPVLGIPMREAKIIVEKAVLSSQGSDVITYEALTGVLIAEGLDTKVSAQQVTAWQEPKTMIGSTKSYGSPGKNSMKKSLSKLNKKLAAHSSWLLLKQNMQKTARMKLLNAIASVMKGGEKK